MVRVGLTAKRLKNSALDFEGKESEHLVGRIPLEDALRPLL
jgi:hypothetical protein